MVARGISFCLISAEKRQVSQKKISDEASEPSPLSTLIHSIPALSFCQHTEQTSHFLDGFHMEYTIMGLSKLPAASSGSGYYLENPYIRVSLYENHSHLGGYITGFSPNVKGFFCLFLPFFSGIFLDISC